ncbi:MAG: helix-turn-helix transcriptional regulator [Balneolales bacterium]
MNISFAEEAFADQFNLYATQMEELYEKRVDHSDQKDDIPVPMRILDRGSLVYKAANQKMAKCTGYSCKELLKLGERYPKRHLHPASLAYNQNVVVSHYKKGELYSLFTYTEFIQLYRKTNYQPLINFSRKCISHKNNIIVMSLTPDMFDSNSDTIQQVLEMDVFKIKHYSQFQQLTQREIEILKLLAEGCDNPRISTRLEISRSTIETHRKNIIKKLNVRHYRDLLRYAVAFDLVII